MPSSPPEDIRCAPLTSTSLQVSWQPPHENFQNGLLQGYKINFEPIVDYTGILFFFYLNFNRILHNLKIILFN